MPLISIVIPALNAQSTIHETLESLEEQSFKDFEVVLIDDGSSDETANIADIFSRRIKIKILSHDHPQGVAQSINDGINASDSKYIARLDSDDIANPLRLEKQVSFMASHPTVGVCGSDLRVFSTSLEGKKEDKYILTHPRNNLEIRTALIQRCAIAHPSVICRRSIFDITGLYDIKFDFAEDYELWCRASLLGVTFSNIPEPLTYYRSHPGQVSSTKNKIQFEHDLNIKKRYISAMLQGEPAGYLPHFFSLQTRFPKENAALAIQQCSLDLLRLAKVIPDLDEYSKIVSSSINRHFS